MSALNRNSIPPQLGDDKLMVLFWAVLAPAMFLYGSALLALNFIPPFEPGSEGELAAYQTAWLFNCIGMALWFAAMSLWSDAIGAGPFAGPLHLPQDWLLIALIAGPVLLFLPNLIIDAVMQTEGWAHRSEVNPAALAPTNWTIAFLFMAAIMAPIAEEVAFRGIALGAFIARGASPYLAAVLSSMAFALIHLQYTPAGMFVVFLAGLGYAALRLLSGSVLVPILAHASGNICVLWVNWLAQSV